MRCPFCHHEELRVIDSRDTTEMNAIRRRRECLECLRRFTTFETIELTMQVHKKDGRYEDFQQEKLVKGMQAACRHTAISHDEVMTLATRITGDLLQRQVRQISTRELGQIVMQHLKKLDPIAYIRYACVYKRFKNIEELVDAIGTVEPSSPELSVHSQLQEK